MTMLALFSRLSYNRKINYGNLAFLRLIFQYYRNMQNNKFFNLFGHYQPSVWRVIEWFQREEARVCTIIEEDDVRNSPQK